MQSTFIIKTILLTLGCFSLGQQRVTYGQAQFNVNPFSDRLFYEGPGVLPSQILRARGYRAEDHEIVTEDGYRLRLTRAWNPLLGAKSKTKDLNRHQGKSAAFIRSYKNRIPILFTHGILESFNVFIVNSFGAKPRNFGNSSLGELSLRRVWHRYQLEPSAKSLPLFALNHGHEVWLMSRRGFPGSQSQVDNPVRGASGETGPLKVGGPLSAFLGAITDYTKLNRQLNFSVNKRFWNFSLDEQAKFDLPAAIDYVLMKTRRKQLSLVGHSVGGAITLMALSLYPDLNRKINNAIFWSQAFSLGRADLFQATRSSRPLLEKFIGAVPPTSTTDQLQAIYALFCSPKIAQGTLCDNIGDLIQGPSFGQAPLKVEFLNSLFYSSSSHELAQMVQNVDKGGQMHRFDYGPGGNLAAYGQLKSPAYNLSRVTLNRMSFYEAETDFMVTVADVEATRQLLRVPHRRHLIPGPFNHNGYFFHKNNARLAVIPSLYEIQQFSEGRQRQREI